MPEIYLHERLAREAVPDGGAPLLLGANGPDLFFFHYAWFYGNRYKLPSLGSRIHKQEAAHLLLTLLRESQNAVQREYSLGFLCHFALDSVLHPFVRDMCAPGAPFDVPAGHGLLEMALDSYYFCGDHPYAERIEPDFNLSPFYIRDEEILQIGALLSRAIKKALGLRIPAGQFVQAAKHMRWTKKFLYRPGRMKCRFFDIIERLLRMPGFIRAHVYPAELPKSDFLNLTHQWGALSVPELYDRAAALAKELINAADRPERLEGLIGRINYNGDDGVSPA